MYKSWIFNIKFNPFLLQFECKRCCKEYASETSLQKHRKTKHAKERDVFKCPSPYCSTTATTVYNLEIHMKAFHAEENLSLSDITTETIETKPKKSA